jgi:hypothetical protein
MNTVNYCFTVKQEFTIPDFDCIPVITVFVSRYYLVLGSLYHIGPYI